MNLNENYFIQRADFLAELQKKKRLYMDTYRIFFLNIFEHQLVLVLLGGVEEETGANQKTQSGCSVPDGLEPRPTTESEGEGNCSPALPYAARGKSAVASCKTVTSLSSARSRGGAGSLIMIIRAAQVSASSLLSLSYSSNWTWQAAAERTSRTGRHARSGLRRKSLRPKQDNDLLRSTSNGGIHLALHPEHREPRPSVCSACHAPQ
ncbi:hypothetical protein CDL15_Pgr013440 [Punica granatum]|uniref:Uncharacterized protein n=1 Tax=Punica granatum TaxID=22663 RepID=A0A218W0Z5_PUNGR|nr:hypothetical protein CDL15_Pgr013440 [Punica granatum]